MFKNLYSWVVQTGLSIGMLLIAENDAAGQTWENVGMNANISAGGSSYNNLAVDAQGNYYLSYYDVSVQKGSVQKFNGTSWSYLGGSAGITDSYAIFNSLTLDAQGNIYYTNQGMGLEVRKFDGSSWTQLVSPVSSAINYQASAVSSSNVLFIYATHGSGTVQRFLNGAWEQVGNAGFSSGASFAEMVIGNNNKIYTCNVSDGVRVYENNTNATTADAWTLVGGSIVDAASSGEQYTSDIALDAGNNLYVAYVSNSAGGQKLNVKKFNGTSWMQLGAPNFSGGRVQHAAIAVTSSGQPYVVASRWENDNFLKNTVYKLDVNNEWVKFGGDFISDDQATYNDMIIDEVNNYLVLAYSEDVTKVKRISITAAAAPTCNNADPGNTPGDTGCVTFNYKGQPVIYTTVRGTDGKIWLQQNLGSSQVAAAQADADSYGDLFQWGRWDDGHQARNSSTTTVPSANNPIGLNGITSFILGSGPSWWSANATSDQWTAANSSSIAVEKGADPCKAIGQGWKLPTQAEWAAAVASEGISNPATAYNSKLKLPVAGNRSFLDGSFSYMGQRGYYWSSDIASSGGKYLYIGSSSANAGSGGQRAQGQSVRCIKDVSGLGTSDITKVTAGIYPNPTNGILTVKADSEIENVNVTNVVGQRINVTFRNNQINLNGFPNGIYVVELAFKNGLKISKIIIKN